MTGDMTYVEKRKYVHDYVYDDSQLITCYFVRHNVNGITVYIAPFQPSENMNNCKGARPTPNQ